VWGVERGVLGCRKGCGVLKKGCGMSEQIRGVENGAETHVQLLVCAFLEEIMWGWVHTRGGVSKPGSGVSRGVWDVETDLEC
jgi:hypothetical protein